MQDDKVKRRFLFIAGPTTLFLILLGFTYAFFNYTRVGSANNIRTGRISFNAIHGTALTLTNYFPMTSLEANNANLDEITISISGDTTYTDGEEFEIEFVDVINTISTKKIPISYIATYTPTPVEPGDPANTIGSSSNTYYTSRGQDSAVYTLNATGSVEQGVEILIGFIPMGATGIDGTLQVKAYVDSSRIAISDTYPGGTYYDVNENLTEGQVSSCMTILSGLNATANFCNGTGTISHENENIDFETALDTGVITDEQKENLVEAGVIHESYTDGTLSTWVNGRTVFTTAEWNELQNAVDPVSFKIRAESNDGTWVANPGSATLSLSPSSGTVSVGNNTTANITTNGDGNLSCETSDPTIATCGVTGKVLTISGEGAGEATITVKEAPGTLFLTQGTTTYSVTVN